jgi:hypothetical protein
VNLNVNTTMSLDLIERRAAWAFRSSSRDTRYVEDLGGVQVHVHADVNVDVYSQTGAVNMPATLIVSPASDVPAAVTIPSKRSI